MRSAIPTAIRATLGDDPWMHFCTLDGPVCGGRTEWHHAFTYAGKRVNDLWSLIPLCTKHHKEEARIRPHILDMLRYRIRFFKAEKEFAAKYPKSDLFNVSAPVVKRGRKPNV